MKLTENRLSGLIDTLNSLICEDGLLARAEREDMVRAVAVIGAVKARIALAKPVQRNRTAAEKKDRVIDPRFPNAGCAWNETDEAKVAEVLSQVKLEDIDEHLYWLSETLGRTPFSVACKIQQLQRLPSDWKDQYRQLSEEIRESEMTVSEFINKRKGA